MEEKSLNVETMENNEDKLNTAAGINEGMHNNEQKEANDDISEQLKHEDSVDIVSAEETNATDNEVEAILSEKEEEISAQSYINLSKPELFEKLKQLAQTDEDGSSWQEIRTIKLAHSELVKDDKNRKLQEFIADGGAEGEFVYQEDDLDQAFKTLFTGFEYHRQEVKKKKDAELLENTNIKKGIVENLKVLAEEANNGGLQLKNIFDRLHEMQDKWRNTGSMVASEHKLVSDAYRFACDKVYEYIQIDKEFRELNYKKNLEIKKELCEKAEQLIIEPSIKKAIESLKQLQEEWKEAGAVSKENNEVIWERFKKASDQVYARLKDYIETIKARHEENKIGKLKLIETLEKTTATLPENASGWQKMTEELELILADWKKLGFAAKKDNETLWNTFKSLRDKFFKAKEAYFEEIKKVHQENYRLKNDLCMKVEEVKDSTDWKKTTDYIITLQKEWKNIGPVNYKQSEKIWQRFRAACDHFFERKKLNFAEQDAVQAENLKAKAELIERIENYVKVEDNNINFENLKNFQNEWLNIGHVPIKEKEKINSAYRKAIDKHFDDIRTTNSEKFKAQFINKINHISNSPGGKSKVNEEMYQLQEKIRRKEHEAALLDNNIGFFGNSKGADTLLKESKKKLELLRNDIKNMKEQMKMLRDYSAASSDETK
ncbi:MAG: DUF349 domain-containing protein [Bacteroidia bacterium]|nr:DUF349 domain-containing protein [Bacteroidia bacterium]MCZ2249800.1 DUF349 domain-containing protein [Bacteroidia bacterium]